MRSSRWMQRAAALFAAVLILGACTQPPLAPEDPEGQSSSDTPESSGASDGPRATDGSDGSDASDGSDGSHGSDASAGSGTALAPSDVLTIESPSTSPDGSYGMERVEVTEDTITSSFTLKDGTQIYSIPRLLRGSERPQLELVAQDYVDWIEAGGTSSCPHSGPTTVTISGSLTHESAAVGCEVGTPIWSLEELIRDVQDDSVSELARPDDGWTIEIVPWSGDGPDLSAPVERYTLRDSGHQDEMSLVAENVPAGWGTQLLPGTEPGEMTFRPGGTGEVLTALNRALLADQLGGCQDPRAEVTIVRSGSPGLIWTPRLCPDQDLTTVTELLRGL